MQTHLIIRDQKGQDNHQEETNQRMGRAHRCIAKSEATSWQEQWMNQEDHDFIRQNKAIVAEKVGNMRILAIPQAVSPARDRHHIFARRCHHDGIPAATSVDTQESEAVRVGDLSPR